MIPDRVLLVVSYSTQPNSIDLGKIRSPSDFSTRHLHRFLPYNNKSNGIVFSSVIYLFRELGFVTFFSPYYGSWW